MPVNRNRDLAGFTFIEVMVTLALIALLATMAVPYAKVELQRQQERELRSALIEIREGLDAYKRAFDQGRIEQVIGDSGYPKSLQVLVDGVIDQQDIKHSKMYFLRRLPRDPFFPDARAPADQTWGKRSYKSPPEQPAEGEDVFDVYSLSNVIGLNGLPYRKW